MIKKLIALLLTIPTLTLVALTPVFAQEFNQNNTVTLPKGQTINNNYFAAGGQVTIDGAVNGDAYIAGGNVVFNGSIDGDLLVAGGTVVIAGHLSRDLRVVGGTVTVTGTIDGNVTAVGGTVQINNSAKIGSSVVAAGGTVNLLAAVPKGATLAGGQIDIDNSIGKDLLATGSQIDLSSNAVVGGNLKYWSNQTASIDPAAKVHGQTYHYALPKNENQGSFEKLSTLRGVNITFKIFALLSALVVGLLLLKFLPRFSSAVATDIFNKFWTSIGIGFLAFILAPITFFILLLTIIGIPLAFIGLVLFAIDIYLTHIFVSLAIGKKLFAALGNTAKDWQALLLGLVIYCIVTLIPIVGVLVWILTGLVGLGAILITKRDFFRTLK